MAGESARSRFCSQGRDLYQTENQATPRKGTTGPCWFLESTAGRTRAARRVPRAPFQPHSHEEKQVPQGLPVTLSLHCLLQQHLWQQVKVHGRQRSSKTRKLPGPQGRARQGSPVKDVIVHYV